MSAIVRCDFTMRISGVRMLCSIGRHEGKHKLTIDPRRVCAEKDCTNLANSRGLCMTHYRSAERSGSLPAVRDPLIPFPESWAEPIDAYSSFLQLRDLSKHTIQLRRHHLRRMAREIDKPPFDVTLDDLMSWVGRQQWKPETTRTARSSLRSFYDWAVKVGRMPVSPAMNFPQVKPGEYTPNPVTEDDFAGALAGTEPRVRLMLRLAGELGLRRAEVAGVHRDDLTETIEGYMLKILGKGRKVRHIPVPRSLAAVMIAHFDPATGWAFPAPDGEHLTPHWVGTLTSRVLPPGYSMHKLRHRALTRAYANTKDILLTSKLAGHSSVATTQAHYVAIDMTELRSLVEGIAS